MTDCILNDTSKQCLLVAPMHGDSIDKSHAIIRVCLSVDQNINGCLNVLPNFQLLRLHTCMQRGLSEYFNKSMNAVGSIEYVYHVLFSGLEEYTHFSSIEISSVILIVLV